MDVRVVSNRSKSVIPHRHLEAQLETNDRSGEEDDHQYPLKRVQHLGKRERISWLDIVGKHLRRPFATEDSEITQFLGRGIFVSFYASVEIRVAQSFAHLSHSAASHASQREEQRPAVGNESGDINDRGRITRKEPFPRDKQYCQQCDGHDNHQKACEQLSYQGIHGEPLARHNSCPRRSGVRWLRKCRSREKHGILLEILFCNRLQRRRLEERRRICQTLLGFLLHAQGKIHSGVDIHNLGSVKRGGRIGEGWCG